MSAAYLKGPSDVLPTIPWTVAHSCQGKHRYDSAMTAAEVASRSLFPMEHYRCNRCGGFHIGRAIGKNGNRKAAKGLIR